MKRSDRKEQTHQRIVDVAARRFLEDGLSGAGVQGIMRDAGLTHGGFYSHFGSKAELVAEAFATAAAKQRALWFEALEAVPEDEWLETLVRRYLSRSHRDAPDTGCPLPAISAEISREPGAVRQAYEAELIESIAHIEQKLADAGTVSAHDRAIGTLALCVGGMLLARAVDDSAVSDDLLRACRRFAGVKARE